MLTVISIKKVFLEKVIFEVALTSRWHLDGMGKSLFVKKEHDHTIRLTVQESSGLVGAVVGEFEKGLECQAKIRQKIVHTMGANEGSRAGIETREAWQCGLCWLGQRKALEQETKWSWWCLEGRVQDANLGSRLLPVHREVVICSLSS